LLEDPAAFVASFVIVILSISFHEFAHAWSAMKLGDYTAYYQGRVTLDPAAHLDPTGTLMILVTSLTGYGFGWGKPVPVNPYHLRYGPRVGNAIVAAAGPLSNLLQAIVWAIPLRLMAAGLVEFSDFLLFYVFGAGVVINIYLALFNLIPLFPLDGGSVLQGVLSLVRAGWARDLVNFLDEIRPYAPMIFIGLILFDQMSGVGILSSVLSPIARQLVRWIVGTL
jgi:Zn-dependent protease